MIKIKSLNLQGCSQPHSLMWARLSLSSFFPQISFNFSYFSSNVFIFFLILAPGGQLTHPEADFGDNYLKVTFWWQFQSTQDGHKFLDFFFLKRRQTLGFFLIKMLLTKIIVILSTFEIYFSWWKHQMRFKVVHSYTKNAITRVPKSQVCYFRTTYLCPLNLYWKCVFCHQGKSIACLYHIIGTRFFK